jgi:hypothetical protein
MKCSVVSGLYGTPALTRPPVPYRPPPIYLYKDETALSLVRFSYDGEGDRDVQAHTAAQAPNFLFRAREHTLSISLLSSSSRSAPFSPRRGLLHVTITPHPQSPPRIPPPHISYYNKTLYVHVCTQSTNVHTQACGNGHYDVVDALVTCGTRIDTSSLRLGIIRACWKGERAAHCIVLWTSEHCADSQLCGNCVVHRQIFNFDSPCPLLSYQMCHVQSMYYTLSLWHTPYLLNTLHYTNHVFVRRQC